MAKRKKPTSLKTGNIISHIAVGAGFIIFGALDIAGMAGSAVTGLVALLLLILGIVGLKNLLPGRMERDDELSLSHHYRAYGFGYLACLVAAAAFACMDLCFGIPVALGGACLAVMGAGALAHGIAFAVFMHGDEEGLEDE